MYIKHGYITFCKQMEVGLYLPVYSRSFRRGNTIFFALAFIAFCDQTLHILLYVCNVFQNVDSIFKWVQPVLQKCCCSSIVSDDDHNVFDDDDDVMFG